MFKAGQFNYKLSGTGKQGNLMGGGITAGYQLRLNKALDLDFNLGLGYLNADYEKYEVIDGVRVRAATRQRTGGAHQCRCDIGMETFLTEGGRRYESKTIYKYDGNGSRSAAGCLLREDTLYNTPHPDYGQIAVTADWSARGEGIDIPATWTVTLGDYTGTETSATHAPDHLFAPGSYTLAVWNPAEGITVSGTTATVAAATGSRADTDALVGNAPGWFFTYTEQVTIEQDTDYAFTAAMKQQVRELTLVIEPTGDAAGRITEIVAYLTGAAGTLDFATDTYGAASSVELPFAKITEGADAGKWTATVRLLGVTGTEQLLTGEIRYADGNPTPTTLKSDLTEALAAFNTGKGESLTLGGTLVETPEGMEVDGAGITGWEEVKG